MTYGTDTTNQPGCNGDPACNWGYEAGTFALQYTLAQGVNPLVTWWLDVETANWSSDTAENDQVILGAINALRGAGINNVGVYTSPLSWNGIAGDFQPAVPLWIAWYTDNPQGNCTGAVSYAAQNGDLLPTGGVWVTQYTDQANGQSLDGDYACWHRGVAAATPGCGCPTRRVRSPSASPVNMRLPGPVISPKTSSPSRCTSISPWTTSRRRRPAPSPSVQPAPDRYIVLLDPAGHPFCLSTQIPD